MSARLIIFSILVRIAKYTQMRDSPSNVVGTQLQDGQGTGTILNDDP
jgi:hypothetical protein